MRNNSIENEVKIKCELIQLNFVEYKFDLVLFV